MWICKQFQCLRQVKKYMFSMYIKKMMGTSQGMEEVTDTPNCTYINNCLIFLF